MSLVGLALLAAVAGSDSLSADAADAGAAVVVAPHVLRESLPRSVDRAGEAELSVAIDPNGEVSEAHLVHATDPELGAAAIDAVGGMVFTPALLDGHPVAVRFSFTYYFAARVAPPPLAMIAGTVLSRGNRQPIPGAVILIDPAVDGGASTTAGPSGVFALSTDTGTHRVQVVADGYQPQTFTETLGPAQRLQVTYRLNRTGASPYETVVYAPSERTEVSRISLTGAETHEVAGTMGDPLRVVMLLPGVGSVASGIAYPVVRGSDPADTGYYLDGIPIPILFHLLLGPEVISPDFIESIDFYPSLPPVDEGRHLTGAVGVTSKAPRDTGAHVTAYADLINAGAFGEVAFPQTGTSISAAARTSYTGWLTGLASRALGSGPGAQPLVLDFGDYQGRIEQAVGGGHLRLFVMGSTDSAGFGASSFLPAEIGNIQFVRVDLRYRHPLAAGEGEVGLTYGNDSIGETGAFALSEASARLRASWKRDLGPRLHLHLGFDGDFRHAVLSLGGTAANEAGFDTSTLATEGFSGVGATNGSFSGAYAELTWRPTASWSVTSAFRMDNYYRAPDVDDLAAEPRLMARYQLVDNLALRAGAGVVHEPPVLLIDLPAVDLGALGHGLQEGLQTELGAEWSFLGGNQLSATAYYNPLFRTVELGIPGGNTVTAAESVTPPNLDPVSRGEAFGLELMLRRPLGGNWFGWVSCALSWSLREQTYDLLDANGNPLGTTATSAVPFAFDETLIANGAVTYRFPYGWRAGLVAHVNTGRPESGILGSYTEVQRVVGGQPTWVPVQLNQVDRLPPFYRLDLQASKTWTLDEITLEGYLDLLNATISWETFGFQYESYGSGPQGTGPTTLSKVPISVPVVAPMLGVRASY